MKNIDIKTKPDTAVTGRLKGIPMESMRAALPSQREGWENST